MLPYLLYGCKTLTCYRRHIKKLDQFHLRCLRKVLRVTWKDHVPNKEILRRAELTGIEAMLNLAQLHWSGHVTRIEDSRLPKQLLNAELSTGKRHKGGQRKRYKDVLKLTLKAYNIPVDEWQALAQDRPAWMAAIREGTKHFEKSRLQSLDDMRSARKNRVPNTSTAVPCQLCGKICASTSGSKLICANTSTDSSSSKSKDYYYYFIYTDVLISIWTFERIGNYWWVEHWCIWEIVPVNLCISLYLSNFSSARNCFVLASIYHQVSTLE